jgi:hypothetical protein
MTRSQKIRNNMGNLTDLDPEYLLRSKKQQCVKKKFINNDDFKFELK